VGGEVQEIVNMALISSDQIKHGEPLESERGVEGIDCNERNF